MRVSWIIIAVSSGFVWLGFILHTSGGDPVLLGKYTLGYLVFLILATICWVGFLHWAWRRRATLAQGLRTFAVIVLIALTLAMFVLPGVYIYLHNKGLDETLLGPGDSKAHAFFQYEIAPPPAATANDTFRILTLGGSTTYGPDLERDQTYPAVLEHLLQSRVTNRDVKILNAGVPWHTSMHSLLRYVARYADWKPDIVIVMHAFNDIFQTSEGRLTSGAYRGDYGHFFGALGRRVNPRDEFRERLNRLISHNWFTRTWYSDLRPNRRQNQKPTIDLIRPLPSFRRNLQALAHRVNEDGGHLILATQPFLYRTDLSQEERASLFYDFYYRDYAQVPTVEEQTTAMQAFNSATREVARQNQITLVDIESHIPKSSEFMYDDVHYTAKGAKSIAGLFAKMVPWGNLFSRRAVQTKN